MRKVKEHLIIILLILIGILIIFHISSTEIFAHPGNTAADGCHYCRTNCQKWGVAANARHCHGGTPEPVFILPEVGEQNTFIPESNSSTETSSPQPPINQGVTVHTDYNSTIDSQQDSDDNCLYLLLLIGGGVFFLSNSKKK